MPFDERSPRALAALSGAREAFRSAVAQAADEVGALLTRVRAEGAGARELHALELGDFAAGRVDVDRFASLFTRDAAIKPDALVVIQKSHAVLAEIAGWSEDGFLVHGESGRDLRGAVAAALATAGRAFGAARAAERARTRRCLTDEDAAFLDGFPQERWNRAERQIAPPLVVEVNGGDLRVGGLAEFLDGTQKLVLVVGSPSPPAALVRLITPGVLVGQICDPAQLAALLSFEGPAVVALVPEAAARFVHDPRTGDSLVDRLTIEHLPEGQSRGQLGQLSAFQRNEELRQLAAFAEVITAPALAAPADPSAGDRVAVHPADHLAAWLLRQADLSEQ